MNEFKMFHISDVLSMTTGRLVSTRHMDGIYDIAQFMTGEPIWTHQLPRVSEECVPALLKQFPVLGSPEIAVTAVAELGELLKGRGAAKAEAVISQWLSKITSGGYGVQVDEMLPVERLSSDEHLHIDSTEEASAMLGDKKIINVVLED